MNIKEYDYAEPKAWRTSGLRTPLFVFQSAARMAVSFYTAGWGPHLQGSGFKCCPRICAYAFGVYVLPRIGSNLSVTVYWISYVKRLHVEGLKFFQMAEPAPSLLMSRYIDLADTYFLSNMSKIYGQPASRSPTVI